MDETALSRPRILANTRDFGWDLASFVAFGLCAPGSTLGVDVASDQDPLEVLQAGGRSSLPKYVVVVSMSDDERGHTHMLTRLNKETHRAKEKDDLEEPSLDGPELSM